MEGNTPIAVGPRRHVLVVDDEPQNLATFRRVCSKYFEVRTAESGEAGLSELSDHEFDVVLTDFGMPGMDGAAFVRAAKQVQSVAMVMVTGYMDTAEVRQLEESGELFRVVGKPWDRATLLEVIEHASEHTRWLRTPSHR